ncbi:MULTISPECIES: LemA family protein [Flagellimonas]|uniref:LemA family protein n=1 Tax=Flagellimonas hadalis TaxID=2597517 RepID=A0A5N5J114_9FLAO|nr:LemA family protein [Allomuricauda hadalis]KAB5492126.1 LemA family protein [Allomuricauda hadalis]
MKIIIIIISVVGLIGLMAIIANNQIISRKNQVAQAFGSIEIYLKKRFDLIPNLVAMLNKYMAHEKEILTKVTELRSQIHEASEPKEKIQASNELTKIMGGLHLNVENYPNLKADTQFLDLQDKLTDIEDHISAARRAYNAAVTVYNTKIQMFPVNLMAKLRKDKAAVLLEIPKAEQKEIDIDQLLNP